MAERRQRGAEADLLRAPAPTRAAPAGAGLQRPPPSSSEPGTNVASASQSARAGAHIACGSGRTTRERAVALELPAVAAVDQALIGPRLGDERVEIAHAARTAGTPIVARGARGPASIFAPAARTSSSVTASSCCDHLGGLDQPAVNARAGARDIGRLPPAAFELHQQARRGLRARPARARAGSTFSRGLGEDLARSAAPRPRLRAGAVAA